MNFLILPVGGSASRMNGIPKFLLPVGDSTSLIENHIKSALEAGFDQVVCISQEIYRALLSKQLSYFGDSVVIRSLSATTATMCETLIRGELRFSEDDRVCIGLSDTYFHGISLAQLYKDLLNENKHEIVLALCKIRKDQEGKLGQVQIDTNGRIVEMKDKDPKCTFPWMWGIALISPRVFQGMRPSDAHIGITLEREIQEGTSGYGIQTQANYFDCGTFSEYKSLLSYL